jgi:hypothetical protein
MENRYLYKIPYINSAPWDECGDKREVRLYLCIPSHYLFKKKCIRKSTVKKQERKNDVQRLSKTRLWNTIEILKKKVGYR